LPVSSVTVSKASYIPRKTVSETVKMVPVHYAGRNGRGKAASFVTYEIAREMVDARVATWGKGAKFLILTKTEAELPATAESLKMGPRIIEAHAEGDLRAAAIVAGWQRAA
jgi:hypothetical protein